MGDGKCVRNERLQERGDVEKLIEVTLRSVESGRDYLSLRAI
jgi:hypothetical protein